MSRTKELVKSSSSIFIAQILISIISILFIAYFARVFTKEQMALFAVIEILIEWNQLLGSLGLGTLAIKDTASLGAKGEIKKQKQLISGVIFYRILCFLILSIGFFIASPVLAKLIFTSSELTPMVRFMVGIGFVSSIQWSLIDIQVAVQRFYSKSIIHVCVILGQRILCVVGFFTFGIIGFFIGYLIASLLGIVATLYDVRQYLTTRLLPFLSMFRESRNYMWLDMLRGIMTQIDRPVVAFFLGAESLAGFYIVKRIYDNVLHLLSAVEVPVGVKFGEVKVEGYKILNNYFRQTTSIITAIFVPLGFLLMVISGPVVTLYAGEKYISEIPIAAAFGFTLVGIALWSIIREAALRLISAHQLMYQYIVSSLVTIVGYVILLPKIGAIAVPFATGLAYLAGSFPTVYFLKKNNGLNLPYKNLLYAAICGFLILFLFIPALSIINPVTKIMFILCSAGLIYIIWLFFLGPLEARTLLKNAFLKIPYFRW